MQQESAEQPHAAQHIDQSGMESSFVSNLVVLVISTMLTIVGPLGMAWEQLCNSGGHQRAAPACIRWLFGRLAPLIASAIGAVLRVGSYETDGQAFPNLVVVPFALSVFVFPPTCYHLNKKREMPAASSSSPILPAVPPAPIEAPMVDNKDPTPSRKDWTASPPTTPIPSLRTAMPADLVSHYGTSFRFTR